MDRTRIQYDMPQNTKDSVYGRWLLLLAISGETNNPVEWLMTTTPPVRLCKIALDRQLLYKSGKGQMIEHMKQDLPSAFRVLPMKMHKR